MPDRTLRRLLIVTPNFWPETFRINEVAEALGRRGVAVTVLTGQPNYPEGRVYAGYRALGAGWSAAPDGTAVARMPVVTRGRGGPVRLALSYAAFLAGLCVAGPLLLRRRRFDAVLFYGVSPMLPAAGGLWLSRIKRAPFALWVQDLWPGNVAAAGFRLGAPGDRLLRRLMRAIYRRSDAVLVASRGFAEDVAAVAGPEVACIYHPNPAERAVMEAEPAPPPADEDQPFEVLFAGNLGRAVGIETILAAAELLRDDPGIRFRLVGRGSRRAWAMAEAARRGLDNVAFVERVPAAAMPALLRNASALLVTLARSPTMALSLPSKTATCLASGRPLLVAADGETARVVREAGAGIAVPAEDAEGLAAAVRRLRALPAAERRAMGAAGRAYCERHFAPDVLAERLVGHLEAMIARRRGPG